MNTELSHRKGFEDEYLVDTPRQNGILLDMLAEVASKTLFDNQIDVSNVEELATSQDSSENRILNGSPILDSDQYAAASGLSDKLTLNHRKKKEIVESLQETVLFDHSYSHVANVPNETQAKSEGRPNHSFPVGETLRNLLTNVLPAKTTNPKVSNASVMHKSKSNYIGQSNTDRVLALFMIEQIKSKLISPTDLLECKICSPPRTFTAPTTLLSHYRSHAGIKPYECRICKAAFTRQHSLNYHLLIHSNETRFTCLECGRKFRHPSHFKEHQRRHTGEAPYECVDCNHKFKTRNTYKRHVNTRHNHDEPPSTSPTEQSDIAATVQKFQTYEHEMFEHENEDIINIAGNYESLPVITEPIVHREDVSKLSTLVTFQLSANKSTTPLNIDSDSNLIIFTNPSNLSSQYD